MWLRTYDPNAHIATELISHQNSVAVFKAFVQLSDDVGGGSATGWGSEGYDDFRDYLEKAETKALGRTLAALGFGTQFTPDFDFEQGTDKVVDAPVRQSRPQQQRTVNQIAGEPQRERQPGTGITDRQISFIRQMWREKGYSESQLGAQINKLYRVSDVTQLERRDASNFIERLKELPRKPDADADMEPVVNQQTGEIIEDDEPPF